MVVQVGEIQAKVLGTREAKASRTLEAKARNGQATIGKEETPSGRKSKDGAEKEEVEKASGSTTCDQNLTANMCPRAVLSACIVAFRSCLFIICLSSVLDLNAIL